MQAATKDDVHAVSPHRPVDEPGWISRRTIAGVLLALTGIGTIMAIITNEALYPADRHYNTFTNSISDFSSPQRWM